MSSQQEPSGWAIGWTFFAAFMMIMVGGFQIIAGFAAILNDDRFVAGEDVVFKFSTNQWGWIHLILGLVVAFAGAAVLAGRTWGRVVGITLALLSAVANFLFIPYYPFWALLIIVLDIFVIWALATQGYDRDR